MAAQEHRQQEAAPEASAKECRRELNSRAAQKHKTNFSYSFLSEET